MEDLPDVQTLEVIAYMSDTRRTELSRLETQLQTFFFDKENGLVYQFLTVFAMLIVEAL